MVIVEELRLATSCFSHEAVKRQNYFSGYYLTTFYNTVSPRRTFGRCKVYCDDSIQVHWLSVAHVVNG